MLSSLISSITGIDPNINKDSNNNNDNLSSSSSNTDNTIPTNNNNQDNNNNNTGVTTEEPSTPSSLASVTSLKSVNPVSTIRPAGLPSTAIHKSPQHHPTPPANNRINRSGSKPLINIPKSNLNKDNKDSSDTVPKHRKTMSGEQRKPSPILINSNSNIKLSQTQGFQIEPQQQRPQTAHPTGSMTSRDRSGSASLEGKSNSNGTGNQTARVRFNQPTGTAALAIVNSSNDKTTVAKRISAGNRTAKSNPGTLKRGQLSASSLAALAAAADNDTVSSPPAAATTKPKARTGSIAGSTSHAAAASQAVQQVSNPSSISHKPTTRRPGSKDLNNSTSGNKLNTLNTNPSVAPVQRLSAADRSLMQDIIYIQDWLQSVKQSKSPASFANVVLTLKKAIFTPAQVKRQRVKQKIGEKNPTSNTPQQSKSNVMNRINGRIGPILGNHSINTLSAGQKDKDIAESDIDGDLDGLDDDEDNSVSNRVDGDDLMDEDFDLPDSSVLDSKISNYINKIEQNDEQLFSKSHRGISPVGVEFVNGRWVPRKENVIIGNSAPPIELLKRQTSGSDSDTMNNTTNSKTTATTNSEDDLDNIPDFDTETKESSTINGNNNTSQSTVEKLQSSNNSNILSTDGEEETDLTDSNEMSVSKINSKLSGTGNELGEDELDSIPDFEPDIQSTNINITKTHSPNMVTITSLPTTIGTNNGLNLIRYDSTSSNNPSSNNNNSAAKEFLAAKVNEFPDTLDLDELNELDVDSAEGNNSGSDSASNTLQLTVPLTNINNSSAPTENKLFHSSGNVVEAAKRLEAKMRNSVDFQSFPNDIDDLLDIEDESSVRIEDPADPTHKKAASGPSTRILHEFELSEKLLADFHAAAKNHNNIFTPPLTNPNVTQILDRDTLTNKIKLDWILAQAEAYAAKFNPKPNTTTPAPSNNNPPVAVPIKRSGTPTLGKKSLQH